MRFLLLVLAAGCHGAQAVPDWSDQCFARFEAARAQLAKSDARMRNARTKMERGLQMEAPDGCHPSKPYDRIELALSLSDTRGLFASIEVGPAIAAWTSEKPEWTENIYWAHEWKRGGLGRLGDVSIPKAQETETNDAFLKAFRRAVDQCIALAPTFEAPPPRRDDPSWRPTCEMEMKKDPQRTANCVDAVRAVRDIEEMCRYESEAVGDGGDPGSTHLAVEAILRLGGDAMPIFQKLARSKNPVARMAAIHGFHYVGTPAARKEIERLASDNTRALTFIGCTVEEQSVAQIARSYLKPWVAPPDGRRSKRRSGAGEIYHHTDAGMRRQILSP